MKFIILFAFVLFVGIQTFGQKVSDGFPRKDYYKYGYIHLKDLGVYEGKDIIISNDTLSLIKMFSNKREKIAISDISYIYVNVRTAVVSGAVLGAVIPFMFILESLIDDKPNAKGVGWTVAAICAGGAAIGGSIGLLLPVWKTYTFKNPHKMTIDYNLKINSEMAGVSLVINF